MSDENNISEDEKIKIAANFLYHSPPGEFREVFLDLRGLLNDDRILKKTLNSTNARYNQDQFVQCELEGTNKECCLITEYNELPNGRYFDPKSKQSFKFDHLHCKASEFEPHTDIDTQSEPWRAALERELSQYVKVHYKDVACSVFGSTSNDGQVTLVACIEAHKFQPANFWNARWRARWSVTFHPGSTGEAELVGIIKVQVHYYEDGNVQLVSHKEVKEYVGGINSEHDRTAKSLIQAIEKCENEYQNAISENYQTMSETTFKALRRALPVTRSKIDWNKISSYKIANELKSSSPS